MIRKLFNFDGALFLPENEIIAAMGEGRMQSK